MALVHHPVLDGQGAVVTTAVTNLDVHDLSRSAKTYGCSDYFVTHPIAAQRELVTRILHHWTEGSRRPRRIPDRREALQVLRVVRVARRGDRSPRRAQAGRGCGRQRLENSVRWCRSPRRGRVLR